MLTEIISSETSMTYQLSTIAEENSCLRKQKYQNKEIKVMQKLMSRKITAGHTAEHTHKKSNYVSTEV